MKKSKFFYFIPAIALFGLLACNDAKKQVADSATNESSGNAVATSATPAAGEAKVSAEDAPVMTFAEQEFEFGTIKEGDVVTHVFKFSNTGKTPLVIQNATASCGCTTPDWTKTPVEPGGKGEITVQFNSKGKSGMQNKQVKIIANTQPEESTVSLKGTVEPGISSMNGPIKQ